MREENKLTEDSAMEEESEIAKPARASDSDAITGEPNSNVQQDALIDDSEPDYSMETEPERRTP